MGVPEVTIYAEWDVPEPKWDHVKEVLEELGMYNVEIEVER